jgi:hypothetical protein
MKINDPLVQELIALLFSYIARLSKGVATASTEQPATQAIVDENKSKAEHAFTQYMETENISVDSLIEIIDKLKFAFGEIDD